MAILTLGVSYRSAPVELLERLGFPEDDLGKAYAHLLQLPAVHGAVLISTCNRVEVIADVDGYHAGFQEVKRFLSESREVSVDDIATPLYSHYEEQAVEHLFEVAAGIDSMVVGEPQILTQVRHAIKTATMADASDPLLDGLFRAAVRTGRRARSETEISASADAFVAAGLELAEQSLGSFEHIELLVLGAGQMAALAVQALQDRGATNVKVLNRSLERADELARAAGGSAGDLANLPHALATADLVVCSTGATGTVVDVATVATAVNGRERPLFFLDLAVPRDVEEAVGSLPGVTLANIDDLGRATGVGDEGAIAAVRDVVSEEVAAFAQWRRNAAIAPLITSLQERSEKIRQSELRRIKSKIATLDAAQWEMVESALRGALNKVLHDPIVNAKRTEAHAEALRKLFNLEEGPDSPI